MENKENKSQAQSQSQNAGHGQEQKHKKNSDFGAKNVNSQESGGGYDHPPKGAGPYKNEEEEE